MCLFADALPLRQWVLGFGDRETYHAFRCLKTGGFTKIGDP